MASLIYIADPMCSWCYAFGPELTTLLNGLNGIRLDIVLGGLRAHNKTPMNAAQRNELQGHWKKVAERTGLPFTSAALEHPGFVYDTEPACRAVVAARLLAPQSELHMLHAIQNAFYARGEDVTQGPVLAAIGAATLTAAGQATDAAQFLATWESEAARQATEEDFKQTHYWGVSGFPTLVLERGGQLELVTSGYVPVQTLVELLQEMVNQGTAA